MSTSPAKPAAKEALTLSGAIQSIRSLTVDDVRQNLRRDWLNHVAGGFRALALVQTDVLLLQGFMLISSSFTSYRLYIKRDLTQFAYVVLFASLSGIGVARLCSERMVRLDERETAIWKEHCDLLQKAEVKKLLSCANEKTVPTGENAKPVKVLESGSRPKLLLLVEGSMMIDVTQREGRPDEHHVELERGPGFTGEVSFVSSLIDPEGLHLGEAMVRADVIVMPGSRYLEFDMGRLEAMMRKQPTLRNAIVAQLSRSVSGKLYATTASVAKANERVMDLHGKLIESQYKTEVLDVTLDTLASAAREGAEHAALAPDGLRVLQPKLERLQRRRGVSTDVHQRVLQEHGLDFARAKSERHSHVELVEATTGSASERHSKRHEHIHREQRRFTEEAAKLHATLQSKPSVRSVEKVKGWSL